MTAQDRKRWRPLCWHYMSLPHDNDDDDEDLELDIAFIHGLHIIS